MKREIRDKWVADLRTNPNLQGKGYLQKDGLSCCLLAYERWLGQSQPRARPASWNSEGQRAYLL